LFEEPAKEGDELLLLSLLLLPRLFMYASNELGWVGARGGEEEFAPAAKLENELLLLLPGAELVVAGGAPKLLLLLLMLFAGGGE